jgi:hypothetical protein
MHRHHASPFVLFFVLIAACGGRIQQGVDSQQATTTPVNAPVSTYAQCGAETCGDNEDCCVGGSPNGDDDDPTRSLEACVPSGTCNTGLWVDCYGDNAPGSVCCITINPTTEYATAGVAATCGGNGLPAVQVCTTAADCPSGAACYTAAIGPTGEGETLGICGGVR